MRVMMPAAQRRSLLLAFLCAAGAGSPRASAQAQESLRIGAGDLLSVHVFRENDLDEKLRVKDAGTIALPLIGSILVANMAAADAAALIARRYEAGGFLNHAQVSILIEESARQQVAVLGEVAHPGTVPLSSPRSLLDVLAEAGGLLKTADRHVTIRRPSLPAITVLVPNDAAADLSSAPLMVSPGDTVLVPRAGIVYVLGDVGRPGGYLMQDDSQLSVMQALAMAAGSTRTAADGSARLIRRVKGVATEQPLHIKAMEKGKSPDVALQNNDIVYIPFSFGKNLALGANTIAASASSALVYAAW
jgi:polysaccharide export outer membrane protein